MDLNLEEFAIFKLIKSFGPPELVILPPELVIYPPELVYFN